MEDPWYQMLELGLTTWEGVLGTMSGTWLRWCDHKGNLIPLGHERADREKKRTERQKKRAEREKQRADALAERLRQLGIDPDA